MQFSSSFIATCLLALTQAVMTQNGKTVDLKTKLDTLQGLDCSAGSMGDLMTLGNYLVKNPEQVKELSNACVRAVLGVDPLFLLSNGDRNIDFVAAALNLENTELHMEFAQLVVESFEGITALSEDDIEELKKKMSQDDGLKVLLTPETTSKKNRLAKLLGNRGVKRDASAISSSSDSGNVPQPKRTKSDPQVPPEANARINSGANEVTPYYGLINQAALTLFPAVQALTNNTEARPDLLSLLEEMGSPDSNKSKNAINEAAAIGQELVGKAVNKAVDAMKEEDTQRSFGALAASFVTRIGSYLSSPAPASATTTTTTNTNTNTSASTSTTPTNPISTTVPKEGKTEEKTQ